MLNIENLSQSYRLPQGKELPALQGLNLSLAEGHMLGLIGESGCGKTTLCHVLTQNLSYQGHITFNGTELKDIRDRKAYYAQVQYIFQDAKSTVPQHMRLEHWALAPLRNLKGLTPKAASALMVELMAQVGLDPQLLQRYPGEVSLGQLQRLSLLKSLAIAPQLLLCDEITSALDQESAAACLELLTRYRTEQGLSVLFITHDLNTAMQWCPEIAVMFKGQVLEQGPKEELCHPYVQSLKAAAHVLSGEQALPPQAAPTLTCPMHHEPLCPWLMRCSKAQALCAHQAPPRHQLTSHHYLQCHYRR